MCAAKRQTDGPHRAADTRQRLFEGQRRLLSAQRRLFSRTHDAFAALQNEQQAFVDRWLDDRRVPEEARELVDTWRVVSDQNRRQLKTAVDASFEALEELLTRLNDGASVDGAEAVAPVAEESGEPEATGSSKATGQKATARRPSSQETSAQKSRAKKKTSRKSGGKKAASKKAASKKAASKTARKKTATRKKND